MDQVARRALGIVAAGLWLTGWMLLTLVPPAPGGRGAGDLLLGLALIPAGAALLLLPGSPRHPAGRGRTVVDGMIVATVLLGAAWAGGLEERFHAVAAEDMAFVPLHVLGAVVLAAMAVVMLTRSAPDARRTLALAAAGLTAVAAGDAALAWLRLDPGFDGAWWPTLLAVAGFGGLLAAARAPAGSSPGLPTRASVYIPSVPLAAGLVVLAGEAVAEGLDGLLIWVGVGLVVLVIARQIFALLENIAFWRDLERDVKRTEARFRSLVQNSSDVITVVAEDGGVLYQSPSVTPVFGHRPERLAAGGPGVLVCAEDLGPLYAALAELEPGGARTLQCRVQHADGRQRRAEIVASNLVDDPDVGGYVLNIRDDTDRRALEEQLAHMAFHDPLTDLANRALFHDRVGHALSRSRPGGLVAALFIDLDDFKNVNDSLGHDVGDELLVRVAERLRASLRPSDTVGRLGGDEFAVLLEDLDDEMGPVRAAERILEAMGEPFHIGTRSMYTRASIGIASTTAGGRPAGDLLRNADTAMYTAKARGKGRYELFDDDMHVAVARRMELEADLRVALERDGLWLAYQPILSLATGEVHGVEALVRWDHPLRGPIGPAEFIPVAEESGLILPLGRWVLRTATAQMRRWHDRFPAGPQPSISVNLSASQLREARIAAEVADALGASGLHPGSLVLELTESLLMDDTEPTIAKLAELRRRGVRIAIDDFGTGYSSLSYLLRFPIDELKIDRSFVEPIRAGAKEAAVVHAIVTMAHALGLRTVAEGIETPEQLQELVASGCDHAQGFHLAVPMPAADLERLLADPVDLVGGVVGEAGLPAGGNGHDRERLLDQGGPGDLGPGGQVAALHDGGVEPLVTEVHGP
jgi:diguanylate cyclase (GGDEF)-like protein/PAS domain S-box-containing protein